MSTHGSLSLHVRNQAGRLALRFCADHHALDGHERQFYRLEPVGLAACLDRRHTRKLAHMILVWRIALDIQAQVCVVAF